MANEKKNPVVSAREYIDQHREEAIMVNVKDIVMTEKIHIHGVKRGGFKPEEHENCTDLTIVVRPLQNGRYSLVIGWKELLLAQHRGVKSIPCLTTRYYRSVFTQRCLGAASSNRKNAPVVESLTGSVMMKLDEIIIPERFKSTPPRREKVQSKIDYYKEHGRMPQPLKLTSEKKLWDGYATYLAAKELNLAKVPVRINCSKT